MRNLTAHDENWHFDTTPGGCPTSQESGPESLKDVLNGLAESLKSEEEDLPEVSLNQLRRGINGLNVVANRVKGRNKVAVENASNTLLELLQSETTAHPNIKGLAAANKIRPRVLVFSDEDRNLLGDYRLDVLGDPPPALRNLLALSGVESAEIQNAIQFEDHSTRLSIEARANNTLQQKFSDSWGQSPIAVQIQLETELIRIHVKAHDRYSSIAERSEGLRAFIALYAYTELYSKGVRPILVIDEAESHLHYDAQADLIKVFENQDSVSKIIYTTHSAGCLPSDLGTRVRVVNQIYDKEGNDTGRSVIRNSFWEEAPGFSPLMLAMGASLLAFAPSRRAVIAEGAADMILLPSMFREVMNINKLEFQIAPGLAIATREALGDLDLEAPRVAYLCDGDEAGGKLASRLKNSGIPEELVVRLQAPYSLEDFLAPELLTDAVNEELFRSHGTTCVVKSSLWNDKGRYKKLEELCANRGLSVPAKTRIAKYVVSKRKEGNIVDPSRINDLIDVYKEIVKKIR